MRMTICMEGERQCPGGRGFTYFIIKRNLFPRPAGVGRCQLPISTGLCWRTAFYILLSDLESELKEAAEDSSIGIPDPDPLPCDIGNVFCFCFG